MRCLNWFLINTFNIIDSHLLRNAKIDNGNPILKEQKNKDAEFKKKNYKVKSLSQQSDQFLANENTNSEECNSLENTATGNFYQIIYYANVIIHIIYIIINLVTT